MPESPKLKAAAVLQFLQHGEKLLTLVAFSALVLVIFADVVSRELTGSGLYWASQTGVWANVVVVMAGFGLATAAGMQLRPRFTDNWLPAAMQPMLATLQHLLMALFSIAFGLLAARVVLGSWRLGELSIDLFLPIWPIQLFLPLAFFAAALRHCIYAVNPSLRPIEDGDSAFVPGEGS